MMSPATGRTSLREARRTGSAGPACGGVGGRRGGPAGRGRAPALGPPGGPPTSIDAFIKAADENLYRAKRSGRNRVVG